MSYQGNQDSRENSSILGHSCASAEMKEDPSFAAAGQTILKINWGDNYFDTWIFTVAKKKSFSS